MFVGELFGVHLLSICRFPHKAYLHFQIYFAQKHSHLNSYNQQENILFYIIDICIFWMLYIFM